MKARKSEKKERAKDENLESRRDRLRVRSRTRKHLPNISKEANAVCVAAVDIVPERAVAACEKYGIPQHYASVYELLAQCDFDIAIDAASIQAHHEINMAVLGGGASDLPEARRAQRSPDDPADRTGKENGRAVRLRPYS